ncbi:MAG: hypothetical protein CFH01_00639, partial [Alphaproteobacteria bacterium MarineAlpha2_Bin1]
LDTEGNFENNLNTDHVLYQRITSLFWEKKCKDLVEEHLKETGSSFAEDLLIHWDLEVGKFWQVVPLETIQNLEQPLEEFNEKKKNIH